ncbi:MAG: LacI family DNA-binding transcriptional regulator [Bacteroidales bacterium]|nr:LacI family DNA-binding transcriptional regulator [Bacteroidales bacterium]
MNNKKQTVTIKSIAKKAGVSVSTVSYVISKKRKISDSVSEHVLSIMKDLGYKPNVVARNLASKKTWCIGLYTPTVKEIQYDLYFNSVLAGIMNALHEAGYQLLLFADYLNESNQSHTDLTMSQPIDGALVMNPRENCVYKNYLNEINLPFVVIGMPVNPSKNEFFIAHDNEAAVSLAINHLLEKGYKKPALVTHLQEYGVYNPVVTSYRNALDNAGYKLTESRIYSGEVLRETGYDVARKALEVPDPADCFVVQNDLVALGLLQYLDEHNIHVPKQVGLVSIGGTLIGELNKPVLTTIAFDPYALGFKSATSLLEIIKKERIRPGVEILPVRLIEGGTS